MSREEALIGLSACPSIGPQKFQKLSRYFHNPKNIWEADFTALQKAGLSKKEAQKFIEEKNKVNLFQIIKILEQENISILLPENKFFPPSLKKIFSPPFLLFYKGELKDFSPCLSIVGTRRASSYGKIAAQKFSQELAPYFTLVSGLALGIDSIVHSTALKKNGQTIAILGSSLEEKNLYPQDNLSLAKKILDKGGLLLSEYPPLTPALPFHFPLRNRLIAGLSLGTLIIESPRQGGSMITAQYTRQENRYLWALPGEIYNPKIAGNLYLLQNKQAALAVSPHDILRALKIKPRPQPASSLPTKEEKEILQYLSTPLSLDELRLKTNWPLNKLATQLSIMEIKGMVKNIDGKYLALLDKR